MTEPIDHHPERRAAQLALTRRTLRDGTSDARALRHACEVVLALSPDPFDRGLAAELLRSCDPEEP